MGIERLSEFWPEWKIEGMLGCGAYGKVYKAVRNELEFSVYSAIKVITIPSDNAEIDALRSEGMTIDDARRYFKEIAEDFVKEIKLMNILRGAPNIVYAEGFNILEHNDGVGCDIFIRMELLTSFKEHLERTDMSVGDVIDLGIDIASALEVCHSHNIIHRDIKPANIFITDFGNYKLGDFGIAKELEKTSGALSTKGTPGFMAPEVARGVRYDCTVDIYSLGLVMYFLLNNKRFPFIDSAKTEITYNDRRSSNERRLKGESLPAPCNSSGLLNEVILTACAYDPSRRFRNATAFKNALMSCREQYRTEAVQCAGNARADETDCDETVTVAFFSGSPMSSQPPVNIPPSGNTNSPEALQNMQIVVDGYYSYGVQIPLEGYHPTGKAVYPIPPFRRGQYTPVKYNTIPAAPAPKEERKLTDEEKFGRIKALTRVAERTRHADELKEVIIELRSYLDQPGADKLLEFCVAKEKELRCIDEQYGADYEAARELMRHAMSVEEYENAVSAFEALRDYLDSEDRLRICREKLEVAKKRREELYNDAHNKMIYAVTAEDYDMPIEVFTRLGSYRSSEAYLEECLHKRVRLLARYEQRREERIENLTKD